MMPDRYHVWSEAPREQGCCSKLCSQCNQCKCEVGKHIRLCPGFDVKEFPAGLEHWKIDLEIERLEASIIYIPGWKRHARRFAQKKLEDLYKLKDRLAFTD